METANAKVSVARSGAGSAHECLLVISRVILSLLWFSAFLVLFAIVILWAFFWLVFEALWGFKRFRRDSAVFKTDVGNAFQWLFDKWTEFWSRDTF